MTCTSFGCSGEPSSDHSFGPRSAETCLAALPASGQRRVLPRLGGASSSTLSRTPRGRYHAAAAVATASAAGAASEGAVARRAAASRRPPTDCSTSLTTSPQHRTSAAPQPGPPPESSPWQDWLAAGASAERPKHMGVNCRADGSRLGDKLALQCEEPSTKMTGVRSSNLLGASMPNPYAEAAFPSSRIVPSSGSPPVRK
mmetsp:Transcript_3964/g.8019  ORF Transcript_3964/g.8019 Transcript_3964/m.8019 type:complete len:200 (-) Transcript_3964:95-694(-)